MVSFRGDKEKKKEGGRGCCFIGVEVDGCPVISSVNRNSIVDKYWINIFSSLLQFKYLFPKTWQI